MPLDPTTFMAAGMDAMVRFVHDGPVRVGNELSFHGYRVTSVHGYARGEVDVIDDVEPEPMLGDDRNVFVPSVRPAAEEERRVGSHLARDFNFGGAMLRDGGARGCIVITGIEIGALQFCSNVHTPYIARRSYAV